ncbi:hypothetical protein [Sphingomonas sp. SORGH_AS_0879]|uniref:hypothetical protein n=1 Tax=Sphingomonas sp. SORGH_AS_0879 TaxID=3041790 RepID=UPI00278565D8|nr:hypothetical protein [Sphingomonas sp. SORGH_AS_0879]MDQ1231679.1 hypothetical protein [Sphingomonas sp. SORGH_AS_0879]
MTLPSESWAADLRAKIDAISADYAQLRMVAETGIDDEGNLHDQTEAMAAATAAANQVLIHIIIALNELPEFHGVFRDGPIPDLMAALDDLRRGQSSDFFRPWPQHKGQLSTKINMLQVRAVASILILERSGASNIEARKITARIFASAGHKGKKGGPIGASTLYDWYTEFASNLGENAGQRIITEALSKLPKTIDRAEAIRLAKVEAGKRL